MNRGIHQAGYEKAWKQEIEKHEKDLLRANKRKSKKTNHYRGSSKPKRKKSKNVAVKVEKQEKDSDTLAEIDAISAEFVDFVFVIWHHYLFKIAHLSLLLLLIGL